MQDSRSIEHLLDCGWNRPSATEVGRLIAIHQAPVGRESAEQIPANFLSDRLVAEVFVENLLVQVDGARIFALNSFAVVDDLQSVRITDPQFARLLQNINAGGPLRTRLMQIKQ